MNIMKSAVIALAMLAAPLAASAATTTTITGATKVGDGAGINALFPAGVSVASNNAAYSSEVTTPASEWVWITNPFSVQSVTYEMNFFLNGYQAANSTLSGLWGVDNYGTVSLNGKLLATAQNYVSTNFTSLMAFSADSGFAVGNNQLIFALGDETQVNDGGQAAFRASATVISAVPLPAGGLLLIAALGGAAALRRRKAPKAA